MPSSQNQIKNKWVKWISTLSWSNFLFLPFILIATFLWLSIKLSNKLQYHKEIHVRYITSDDVILKDKLDEKLRSTDEDLKKIRWEITKGNVPFTDFNAYMIVSKGSNDNESVIQWTARFYRVYKLNPPIPEGQDDATAKAAVQGFVDSEGFTNTSTT